MNRILVIEDDFKNMKLVKDILKANGFEVLEAQNGKAGFELAVDKRPDLILMDYIMPEIDGIEATQMIKSNDKTIGIPIIMLTASAMMGDREKMISAGCDDYISKPIDIDEFLGIIKFHLKK